MSSHSTKDLLAMVKKFIPNLSNSMHKGQSGKIGVVGGSFEYTGAPYYASISALKTGVDIAHVFCDENAATAIKSYSPEAIVHPVLKSKVSKDGDQQSEENQIVENITKWFPSLHVLIVGPGLGREEMTLRCAKSVIQKARENKLPLVIDGDGLFLLNQDPSIIEGYQLAILTPNVAEYKRLLDKMKIEDNDNSLKELSKRLGDVTIVRKGDKDVITDGKSVVECSETGNSRRSGGQGDVLTGCIASFFAWSHQFYSDEKNKDKKPEVGYPVLSAFGGCTLSRMAGREAFLKHVRSTTAPNIIDEIGPVFERTWPCEVSRL